MVSSSRSGTLLLLAEEGGGWQYVKDEIRASETFASQLADLLGRDDATILSESLSDEELAEVYLWIAGIVPPQAEIYVSGRSLPARYELHDFRNSILATLVSRGTSDAVRMVRRISTCYPDDLRLRASLIEARRNAQARSVSVPSPGQVALLLNDSRRRIVNSATQLAEVVSDVILAISRDLHTHANLLWDSERGKRPAGARPNSRRPVLWRPKPEGALVVYLQNQLLLRLQMMNVVINREVVVSPTDEGDSGERPDLLVQAVQHVEDDELAIETLSVPIEVKGSWHADVRTAQRTQLSARYLPPLMTNAGVYVVGWFPTDLWTCTDDSRRRRARNLTTIADLSSELVEQAAELMAESGHQVKPVVISIERAVN